MIFLSPHEYIYAYDPFLYFSVSSAEFKTRVSRLIRKSATVGTH